MVFIDYGSGSEALFFHNMAPAAASMAYCSESQPFQCHATFLTISYKAEDTFRKTSWDCYVQVVSTRKS